MDTELEQARQHFLEGIEHFEAERFDQARLCFETSLSLAPGRASVLSNLGITHFRLGQWNEAIPLLQRTTAADPSQLNDWIYLGLAHETLSEWQAAADSLMRALELDPQRAGLWLVCGQCQLRLGFVDLAMQAFDRAVTVDPNLIEAWSSRGSLLRELNHLEEAGKSFERAISLGADPVLHGYYLASVKDSEPPPAPPRQYVEALFDDYAADFQTHLVEKLQYQAHKSLIHPLLKVGQRYHSVLDLGCGSGLCGPLIYPLADSIDGIDVSKAMLAQARQLGVYRDLTHADLTAFLTETTRSADLVLAADVFIYVGELSDVFRAIRRILEPTGCFAFTVELSLEKHDIHLLPSLRYAHSESYIRHLANSHGFTVQNIFTAPLRYDQLQPVQGLYVYLN